MINIHISHFTLISHFSSSNEKISAQHFPSLKAANLPAGRQGCELKIANHQGEIA